MNTTTLLGLFAGALTTIASLPQAYRSWKTKQTHDISLLMYIILSSGVLLWLVYGIMINDTPIILANGLTFILVGYILILKIMYK